jgi:hypothetical protein
VIGFERLRRVIRETTQGGTDEPSIRSRILVYIGLTNGLVGIVKDVAQLQALLADEERRTHEKLDTGESFWREKYRGAITSAIARLSSNDKTEVPNAARDGK